MSEKNKKLWVRLVCGFLALLMVGSCLAILTPII